MNWDQRLKTLIEYCFYALLFIVPIIWLPGHVELFQFNKMIVVYLLTTIITASWLLRMIIQGKFFFKRTPLDLPIILFLGSQCISTLLSIEPHTSIWGYYSRFHGGLLSTISYILLYYAFVSNGWENLSEKLANQSNTWVKRSLITLLASTTVVSIYGILEHFGIDENYWVQDVRNRIFSTLGQPNWLAALLVTVIPFTFIKNLFKKSDLNSPLLWIPNLLFTIFYLTLLYTKSRSGFLGFMLMFLSFWFLLAINYRKKKVSQDSQQKNTPQTSANGFQRIISGFTSTKLKQLLLTPILIMVIITILVGSPFTPSVQELTHKLSRTMATPSGELVSPKNKPIVGGTPSEDIRMIVWRGAIDVWRHWPIFGSGVETFAYSYYNFRPVEHNNVSEWDFLYNKAHNEYLNVLATTGSVGLLTYIFLQFSFLKYSISSLFKTRKTEFAAFASGYLGLSVVNFFGFSTVTVGMLFFLLPAFAVLIDRKNQAWIEKELGTTTNQKLSLIGWITIVTVLVLMFSALTEISIRWYADRIFSKGKDLAAGVQISEGLLLEQEAASLVKDEPVFHDQLSLELARSAAALYVEGSTESAKLLASASSAHSDVVMSINPLHINFLKNRTAAMIHLSIIDPIYKEIAFQTLLQATSLSPTDPKLPFNLGLIYLDKDDQENALIQFQHSIELKKDYAPPRIELAALYELLGEPEKAKQQYEYVLKNIDPNHPQAKIGLERVNNPPQK